MAPMLSDVFGANVEGRVRGPCCKTCSQICISPYICILCTMNGCRSAWASFGFFLSRLVRTTWMGYNPMSLLLFFGSLFEFVAISLWVSAFADAHKRKHIRDFKSLCCGSPCPHLHMYTNKNISSTLNCSNAVVRVRVIQPRSRRPFSPCNINIVKLASWMQNTCCAAVLVKTVAIFLWVSTSTLNYHNIFAGVRVRII